MEEPKYLPHLEGALPEDTHGYTVSSYCMALEGWRRGLTLKFINKNRRKSELVFSFSNGEKEHVFSVARGDLVPRSAINICMDKGLTKEALIHANVPTPIGKAFQPNTTHEEYINYADYIGYPVVVKPLDGTAGKGVITGIRNDQELINALTYVKEDLNYKHIIVEKYAYGSDYRLYVLDGKVIAIFTRDRANVIGDGKSTIKQLVNKKNELRAKNPALKGKSKIKLGKEAKDLLAEKGYTYESVPEKGEKIYLNTKNNVSSGGDPTDATDLINDKMKDIAVKAAKAIPGLVHCGVDMIIDEDQSNGYVLEINSRPHIRAHLFPMQGEARDVPKEIFDYYFPETKDIVIKNKLYFDFELMYESFRKGYCSEYVIPEHPENVDSTRYVVSSVTNNETFAQWVKKQAVSMNISGYCKKINNQVSIVLVGSTDNLQTFEEKLKEAKENLFTEIIFEKKERNSPIKVGFEVINMKDSNNDTIKKNDPNVDGYFPVRIPEIKKQKAKKTKKSGKTPSKQIIDYEKEYKKIINSTSWKITKPLRAIGRLFKK